MSNDNNVSVLQRLFNECKKDNPDLNKIDEYINECRCKNKDMNALLKFPSNSAHLTPLHVVCIFDHHEIVERLLDSRNHFKYSVDVNVNSDGNFPNKMALHYAYIQNYPLTVRALLQHPNIEVNKVDENHATPLHLACRCKCKAAVMELLKYPNIQLNVTNSYGDIPLHSAFIHNDDTDIIQMLIGHQQQKYRILQLNAKNSDHQTPLHVACSYNNLAAVEEILRHVTVIDINATDRDGKTALCIACSRSYTINSNTVRIIQVLLEQPSIMIHNKNNDGKTPLDIIRLREPYSNEEEHYLIKILQLFNDYHVRRRCQLYCFLLSRMISLL